MEPMTMKISRRIHFLIQSFFFCFILLQTFSAHANEPFKILILGDSHLGGPFGDRLYQKLAERPDTEVHLYSSCGTTVRQWYTGAPTRCDYFYKGPNYRPPYRDENGHWVSCSKRDCIEVKKHNTPLAKDLLKTLKPDLVIIEHGTNYGEQNIVDAEKEDGFTPLEKALMISKLANENEASDPAKIKEMRKLAQEVRSANAKCVWVGLPDTKTFRSQQYHLASLIQEATHPEGKDLCQFIDSTQITQYPDHAPDGDPSGVHYFGKKGTEEARHWADQVVNQLVLTNTK